jgi:hypothetical protein
MNEQKLAFASFFVFTVSPTTVLIGINTPFFNHLTEKYFYSFLK